ncbi:hypothetical protein PMAYCL1PPCAC_04998, partial [Pristionchus mayeri]
SVCGKKFCSKEYLKKHLLAHTGEKPFKCPYCILSFNSLVIKNNHAIFYHEMKPYLCLSCGKQFDQKFWLNHHLSTNQGHTDQEQLVKSDGSLQNSN